MRRSKQQLSEDETRELLARGTWGTLSVTGDDGYPYGVPLNYVYLEGKLYFHCAKSGHKLDAIESDPRASFCVVDKSDIVKEEYTTYFRSAIAFGRARIVADADEKLRVLRALGARFNPDPDALQKEVASGIDRLEMIEFEIEHLTGKEAIELTRGRGHQSA